MSNHENDYRGRVIREAQDIQALREIMTRLKEAKDD